MKPWVVCLCTLSFTACLSSSRSPEARFYQLQPVRMEVEDVSFPYDGVLVDDVETAEYLDRPQMVVRQGEHRLDYLEFDRWAEPLDENFADVLVREFGLVSGVRNAGRCQRARRGTPRSRAGAGGSVRGRS